MCSVNNVSTKIPCKLAKNLKFLKCDCSRTLSKIMTLVKWILNTHTAFCEESFSMLVVYDSTHIRIHCVWKIFRIEGKKLSAYRKSY